MKEMVTARAGYSKLREEVEKALLLGQKQVEQAKVRTYWRTGRLIQEHLLKRDARSDHYGKQIIEKLSSDLDVHPRLLWRCLQFAQSFKILSGRTESLPAQLSWSHYRELMTVPDEGSRASLMKRAEKSQWSSDELSEKIRLEVRAPALPPAGNGKAGAGAPKSSKLIPKRGELYTYRLVRPESVNQEGSGEIWIDLGFQVRRRLAGPAGNFKEGRIVESKKAGKTYSAVLSKRAEEDLFTYGAAIERIVDGDTMLVNVDLGFETRVRQYLRLRGLDCPELVAPEGRKAKAFVEKTLAGSRRIILTSSRSDKYDRYLADVFYESGEGEEYLNQALLDRGLAGRMG